MYDRRDERREERVERREERNHKSPQRRKSCEQCLERPVRGFISTISGGFTGGGVSSSARKKHLRNIQTINTIFKKISMPPYALRTMLCWGGPR